MLVRIIVGIALLVFAAGFIWFAAQVIWLGTKEFFRIHSKTAIAPATSTTSTTSFATTSSTAVAP